jgi:hypothetical protein
MTNRLPIVNALAVTSEIANIPPTNHAVVFPAKATFGLAMALWTRSPDAILAPILHSRCTPDRTC